jgi:isoprenylcysteine carboxyl methyltransferase (ICMT) family protein YpbQ
MLPYLYYLIDILWIIFWMYWLVSSLGAKKSIQGKNWVYSVIIRLIFAVIIIILMQSLHFRNVLKSHYIGFENPFIMIIGTIIIILSLAFAVWARVYLGKNWGIPMSQRENPELVTLGPYTYVRHPIYTGILFALLGTGIAIGNIWFVVFVFAAFYFIFAAIQEEKLMVHLFPDQYPAYMKQTKMLVPFVF